MATDKTIARIESWVWILIYGGLLGIVLGIASMSATATVAWSLIVAGSVLTVAGVILIWIRSRLEPPR